jgi:hypothetical protein
MLPRNLLVAFGAIAVMLSATFLYIHAGQPYERLPIFDYAFFPLVLVAFTWANWPRFKDHQWPVRVLSSGLVGLLVMAIWLLPAIFITIYFHIGLGGRL